MKVVGVIPARWASTRFPGKSLAMIAGKPMLAHVWERAKQAKRLDELLVATDDVRIAEFCSKAGFAYVMTSTEHATGTDRMSEVAQKYPAEIYVNIQGDEPLIDPAAIDAVTELLLCKLPLGIEVSTAYIIGTTVEQDNNPNVVHLVPTLDDCVLTFSRLPVPMSFRSAAKRNIHVGLYAFTRAALTRFSQRVQGPVEKAESIEQMRFMEYGDRIACVAVKPGSIGVDHPEDIARVEALLTK